MDTRTEIILMAENLIRTKGYNAFSYKDISVPMNVKNAAIHYHFPTKEDLGIAVVELTMQSFQKNTQEWESLSVNKKLESFMQVYERSSSKNLVCFMGALGPAFETLPAKMQAALTQASLDIRSWLTQVLQEGKESGDLQFSEKAYEKADLIVSSMLSSLILKRVCKEDVFSNVKSALLKTL